MKWHFLSYKEWDWVHVEVLGSRPTGSVSNLPLKKNAKGQRFIVNMSIVAQWHYLFLSMGKNLGSNTPTSTYRKEKKIDSK